MDRFPKTAFRILHPRACVVRFPTIPARYHNPDGAIGQESQGAYRCNLVSGHVIPRKK